MARFTFALEPLLLQRRAGEQQRQQIFAAAQQRLRRQQDHLTRLESALASQLGEIGRTGIGPLAEIERRIHALRAEMPALLAQAEEARQHFLNAMRDRKALEILKRKQYMAHAAREARKEEHELDEANRA